MSQGRPVAAPATLSTEHNASNAPLPSVLLVPTPPGLFWLRIAKAVSLRTVWGLAIVYNAIVGETPAIDALADTR
jgi:hypothetical protein